MSIQAQADYFFNAYFVLHENNEDMIEVLAKLPQETLIGGRTPDVHPTIGVDIVCLAFSLELYIKDLHYAIEGEARRGHNIFNLFNDLPDKIKEEIFSYESISQNPFMTRGDISSTKRFSSSYGAYNGFIDQMKLISDGFEKWRYSYESMALSYDISFALAFIAAIKSVTGKVRNQMKMNGCGQ